MGGRFSTTLLFLVGNLIIMFLMLVSFTYYCSEVVYILMLVDITTSDILVKLDIILVVFMIYNVVLLVTKLKSSSLTT